MSGFFFFLKYITSSTSWNSLYSIIANFSAFISIPCTQFTNELVIPLFIDASLSDIYLSYDEEAVNLNPLIIKKKKGNLKSNHFFSSCNNGVFLFINDTLR